MQVYYGIFRVINVHSSPPLGPARTKLFESYLKAVLPAVFVIFGAQAAFAETFEDVRATMAGPWTVASISAVWVDSCTGPHRIGFRLKRERGGVTIASVQTRLGETVYGAETLVSQIQLDGILSATALHYQSAMTTKSVRELLDERFAAGTHSGEEKLMEIARVGRFTSLDSLGISLSFGDDATEQRYMNEFDEPSANAFLTWIREQTGSKKTKTE